MFWDFWQINGWYGVWSKYHLFYKEGENVLTACGKYPQSDNFMPIRNNGKEPKIELRCKKCQRIYEKKLKEPD